MGIVRFALRFPHTFYVLAGLMLFLGCSAILVTPKDIFPAINIPVVTVIWQYTGLSPAEMEQRITTYSEYSISASVSDVRNIESQTLEGIAVEKVYFQPNVNISLAIAQLVSASNFDPRADARRRPAADHRAVQRFVGSGTAAQPQFGHAERTAALRLRHVPGPPATGANSRHHTADAGRRQVSPDHGLSRPGRAARPRRHAERRGERGERPEPHAALGRRQVGRQAVHRAGERDAAVDRGAAAPADQAGRPDHGLSVRRGACGGFLGGPAEHRACRGQASSAAHDHQERRRVHARCGERT